MPHLRGVQVRLPVHTVSAKSQTLILSKTRIQPKTMHYKFGARSLLQLDIGDGYFGHLNLLHHQGAMVLRQWPCGLRHIILTVWLTRVENDGMLCDLDYHSGEKAPKELYLYSTYCWKRTFLMRQKKNTFALNTISHLIKIEPGSIAQGIQSKSVLRVLDFVGMYSPPDLTALKCSVYVFVIRAGHMTHLAAIKPLFRNHGRLVCRLSREIEASEIAASDIKPQREPSSELSLW